MEKNKKYILLFGLFCLFMFVLCCVYVQTDNKAMNSNTNNVCPDCGTALVKSNLGTTIKIHSESYASYEPVKCFKGSVKCLGEKNVYTYNGQSLAYESAMCDYYSKDTNCKIDANKVVHNVVKNDGFVEISQTRKVDNASGDIKCVIYYCPSCKYAVPIAN